MPLILLLTPSKIGYPTVRYQCRNPIDSELSWTQKTGRSIGRLIGGRAKRTVVWILPRIFIFCINTSIRPYVPIRTYRLHNVAARRPDPEIPADPGHHSGGTVVTEQTQNPLFAGAHHRRCGDRPPRPEPGSAR